MKKWWLLGTLFLLINPIFNLYQANILPGKIDHLQPSFNNYAQSYELSLSMSNLFSAADAYLVGGDLQQKVLFNEAGRKVLENEMEILNSLSQDKRAVLTELVYLTEEYISYTQTVVSLQDRGEAAFSSLRNKQSAMEMNLSKRLKQLFEEQNNSLKTELKTVARHGEAFKLLNAAGGFLTLAIVFLVAGFLIYPELKKYILFKRLTYHTQEITLICDAKGKLTSISPNAEKLLGILSSDWIASRVSIMAARQPQLQNVLEPVQKVLAEQKPILNHHEVILLDKEQVFLHVNYYPAYILKRFSGVLILIQTAEIKKDQQFIYETLESERKKISLEIHDWIGRNMSSIIHTLDFMLRSNAHIPVDVQNDLIRLRTSCQSAVIDMRSIMYEIHPYLIDKVGLIPALQAYSTNFEQMQNIKVNMFYPVSLPELDKNQEIVIYRIVQEALSNVVKHSSASEVDIYLSKEKDMLKVEIVDNGTPGENYTAGKGMWGMKERARSLGGDLSVVSDLTNGFGILLTIPLKREEQHHGTD